MSQLSSAQTLAAGVHAPPTLAKAFAATQAAWRFYSNNRVALTTLCGPLIEHARAEVPGRCGRWLLVVLDWCNLHYNGHDSKHDRVELSGHNDLGYELLTALGVCDADGSPIAPLCLELRSAEGLHTTRCGQVQPPRSQLDALDPVMAHIRGLSSGKPPVFVIDREADSVGHYRRWDCDGHKFIVRANQARKALYEGRERELGEIADGMRRAGRLGHTRGVLYKGKPATQYTGEVMVVLHRPAYQHRVAGEGAGRRKRHKVIAGAALALRLIVAEVRDRRGKVLARWLLLSNLPRGVTAAKVALWYYWRWRIESYHKLLKGAGQQVEHWQQETARSLVRRLLVTAMSCVVVWRLARDKSAKAKRLRQTLVRLSGRQLRRGKGARGFTEPALLAGLCVAVPMLTLLQTTGAQELKALFAELQPLIRPESPARPKTAGSG